MFCGEVAEWPKAVDSKSTVGKPTVGSNPTLSAIFCRRCLGEVTEWPKVHDWKSCVPKGTAGSNPALSAILPVRGGDGRVFMTGRREPRQIREEATVSVVPGHEGARPSPPRTFGFSSFFEV